MPEDRDLGLGIRDQARWRRDSQASKSRSRGKPRIGSLPTAGYNLAYASDYDPAALLNARPIVKNSRYGQPYLFQNGRSLRLGAHYTF
jgi:hypothetical protein